MNVLVSGSKGFVGTETVRLLVAAGHSVVEYDLMDGKDIRDLNQLEQWATAGGTQAVDRILHLAAIARFDEADANPILTHETNVVGTMNVCAVAAKHHIPVVFASTGSAYMPIKGTPPITEDFPIMGNSVYGCSKALSELYVRRLNPHIVLRYSHLYGAEKRWHGLIGGFLSRIEHDLEPILYNGAQSNDFLYVRDVARANLIALEATWDKWNECYNIGTGEELTAKAAGDIICKAAGYDKGIEIRPGRAVDAERFVYDMTKANTKLGFTAEWSFEDGMEDMMREIEDAR